MKHSLYGLVVYLCALSPPDPFASAEENKPRARPSVDSFESSVREVSSASNNFFATVKPPRNLRSDLVDTVSGNAFMLNIPGTGHTLGVKNCFSDDGLTTVPLNTSSFFQMWKYDSDTGRIHSVACPHKLLMTDPDCESVTVVDEGSVDATDLTSFNFNNAPHLSDDETFGVTISSFDTSRCDAKVLTPDKVGEGSVIVMKDDGNGNIDKGWLYIDLSYGENYFYVLRKFLSGVPDVNYAASISMTSDGELIAISGSESDDSSGSSMSRGYVKLYNSSKTLLHKFTTKYVDQVAPVVNVGISGNGEKLAIGAVFPTEDPNGDSDTPKSGVQVYDLTADASNKYGKIGDIIDAGEMGDLPGLRLDWSEDGSKLIVGGRNYKGGRGRVRVYNVNTNGSDPITPNGSSFEGAVGDHLGSSVSTSGGGKYLAIGVTGGNYVSVFDITTDSQVGKIITGTKAGDAMGFSVDLVEIGDDLYVAVASIFFDTEGSSNRGKVDIYTLPSNSDADIEWKQIGQSLYGDRGATLDFVNGKYHIGDSFGFSLGLVQTEDLTLRVAVGSPFFSNVRESDAYYGVVKLFELDADKMSWIQLAYDIVGISKTSASGTSIALVNGGDTLAIGGGPDSTGSSQGSVIVYAQDETSSKPSSMLSPVPSEMPSREPSSDPSSRPSFVPSEIPSRKPSSDPSSRPSSMPSKEPSSYPSNAPSSKPSSVPSQQPSNIPSVRPSVSREPSSQPSDFREREFMILSKFKKLTELPMENRTDQNWCLERLVVSNPGDGSPLKMRPCDTEERKQMWFYHKQKKVIASASSESNENTAGGFCITRSGRQLVSISCTGIPGGVNTIISEGALDLSQDGSTGPISMEKGSNEFYFAIDSIKIFSRVKLFKKGTENSSFDKWHLRYKGPSDEFPSSIPSTQPSNKSSVVPSTVSSTDGKLNGEEACEGHEHGKSECLSLGDKCCAFDDHSGQCFSNIGQAICHDEPLDGESACEGHGYDYFQCNSVGGDENECCYFDEISNVCFSYIGTDTCENYRLPSDTYDIDPEDDCEGLGYSQNECMLLGLL